MVTHTVISIVILVLSILNIAVMFSALKWWRNAFLVFYVQSGLGLGIALVLGGIAMSNIILYILSK